MTFDIPATSSQTHTPHEKCVWFDREWCHLCSLHAAGANQLPQISKGWIAQSRGVRLALISHWAERSLVRVTLHCKIKATQLTTSSQKLRLKLPQQLIKKWLCSLMCVMYRSAQKGSLRQLNDLPRRVQYNAISYKCRMVTLENPLRKHWYAMPLKLACN